MAYNGLTKKQKLLACGLGVTILMQYEYSKRHLNRRWWTRPWATEGWRASQGFGSNLVARIKINERWMFSQLFPVCLYNHCMAISLYKNVRLHK